MELLKAIIIKTVTADHAAWLNATAATFDIIGTFAISYPNLEYA